MKKLLILIFILCLSNLSYGQTKDGNITLTGGGTITCGNYMKYSDEKKSEQMEIIYQWVYGFLTGYQMRGSFGDKVMKSTQNNIIPPDKPTIDLFMRKYCSENPLSSVMNGSIELTNKLGGKIK